MTLQRLSRIHDEHSLSSGCSDHDFLNREPDAAGCSGQSILIGVDKLVSTSKREFSTAFYLSIEFQQTGYLAVLMQKESSRACRNTAAFMRDLQEVSRACVNTPGWQQKLSDNQQQFAEAWANRPEFKAITMACRIRF